MSRYHPVRPKKQTHEQHKPAEAAQQAAPEPTREQVAREQYRAMFDSIYKIRDGHILEAAIERWKDTLALYDQERAAVKAKNDEGHRWTVSPTVALRIEMHLEKLLERRSQLKIECHAETRQRMERLSPEQAANNPLCQPKQSASAEATADRPATTTDSGLGTSASPTPAEGDQADARHIAA
jgi:hypothetical protein